MNLEKYAINVDESALVYEFISEGPKGKLSKLVIYTKIFEE